ncbi:signal transduction histidine kinase [Tumebacillus sp. BK434]|uniref:sensor histidine kinase n=1 Tax=Tumebacillus sp. BK434 TaxID=2512169 RepID=UPI001049A5B8|nr:sensor histidine kinase [Tumebacillus sp. BK434]TCP57961.1 signal transduction histidine kinase [Tumebacillus sp. BK434]
MKLFLRDHAPLCLLYLAQLGVTLLLLGLSGRLDVWLALYDALLTFCLLLLYLAWRYWRLAAFYQRLQSPVSTLDHSIQDLGDAPAAEALDELLRTQYRQYQSELHSYERRIRDHVTFINQWVHGMKTPLSVIHLTIQEEDEPIFHSIREETERLRQGLETVLYTSRLDAFEHDFHVEPVSLQQLARNVINEHKAYFIRSRIFPELQIPSDLLVYSDEKWLGFLLGQLVTNAVRYSADTGGKVTLRAHRLGRIAFLEVADQGVGIPVQDHKRVFDAYFTGENGRRFPESTGMGLYLVKQICDRLGHTVELDSEPGQGTTVRLCFHNLTPM